MAVVLTWNVQGRVRGIVEQATALAGRRCDVVALQEVRATALAGWEAALAHLGYPHVAGTLPARRRAARARAPPRRRHRQQDADRDAPGGRGPVAGALPRRTHLARRPGRRGAQRPRADQPEGRHGEGPHARGRPRRARDRLRRAARARRRPQHPALRVARGGRPVVRAHARRPHPPVARRAPRPRGAPAHHRARASTATSMRSATCTATPGATAAGCIHTARPATGWTTSSSRGLAVAACEYEHAWRDAGLSDHAAMWADLRPPAPPARGGG